MRPRWTHTPGANQMKRSQSPSHYSASDILYNAERNKGNMDVFKLAFETTIVGVLAFLWIGIAIDLLLPSLLPRIVAAVTEKNQTLVGLGVLSLAYCLGSATLPISSQLVNDEHWPLPEDAIRCWVSIAQESQYAKIGHAELPKQYIPLSDDLLACRCTLWDRLMPVDPKTGKRGLELSLSELRGNDDAKKQRILTMFQLREAKVMNQSPEKTERIRQLHERIVVLRGAVLQASVLLLIGSSWWSWAFSPLSATADGCGQRSSTTSRSLTPSHFCRCREASTFRTRPDNTPRRTPKPALWGNALGARILAKIGASNKSEALMEMTFATATDSQPTNLSSWMELPEDVWRRQREAAMIRACRILGIPYKPEYAEIGR